MVNIYTGSRPCPYDSDFRCNDGYCIWSSGVCNRYNNCRDGSDEINCGKYETTQLDNAHLQLGKLIILETSWQFTI